MANFKKFTEITQPDDSCWTRDQYLTWMDTRPWDWDLDGIPPGLTSDDRYVAEVYKLTKRARLIASLTVDTLSVTNDTIAYYANGIFELTDVKVKGSRSEFLTFPLPEGSQWVVAGGESGGQGLAITEHGGTTQFTLTMDYFGPVVAITTDNSLGRIHIDVSQFRWTGEITAGATAAMFHYQGGNIIYGNTVITTDTGSIELPADPSSAEYYAMIYVDPTSGTIGTIQGSTVPAGMLPLYKIKMNGSDVPCSIVEVVDLRTWIMVPNYTAALAAKADLVNGQVPANQLPSYVDDVLEYATASAFPETGETGKIYVDISTKHTYRWSGSVYIDLVQDFVPYTGATSTLNLGAHGIHAAFGTMEVLADVTLTAVELPTYPVTVDTSTDIVTFPEGTTILTDQTFYLEGANPPTFGDAVSRTFTSEWVGPVLYAVNISGNTCKLSATKAGTALDITAAGSGWTLRVAGLNSITAGGFSESTPGAVYEILCLGVNGFGWDSVNAWASRAILNNQNTSEYRNTTSEGTTIFGSSGVGNIDAFSFISLIHNGSYVAGLNYQTGLTGTDRTFAGSVPRAVGPQTWSYNPGSAFTWTSVGFIDPNGSTWRTIKVGTRLIVRRVG